MRSRGCPVVLRSDTAVGHGPDDFAINDVVDHGGDLDPHCAASSVAMA
jgi:hypothetical protein